MTEKEKFCFIFVVFIVEKDSVLCIEIFFYIAEKNNQMDKERHYFVGLIFFFFFFFDEKYVKVENSTFLELKSQSGQW